MAVAWLYVVISALGALMVLFATWAMLVGLIEVISGERLERCRRCGRLGFTDHGERHPQGCGTPLLHLGGHHVLGSAARHLPHH